MLDAWRKALSHVDIYLLDYAFKGGIAPGMKVLDAGCGMGRNSHFLLDCGAELTAVDGDVSCIVHMQATYPSATCQQANLGELPFVDESFDLVVSNAVLHFADSHDHFDQMVSDLWRVVAPGGVLFARLCSDIGLESPKQPVGEGRYILADGSTRYVSSLEQLTGYVSQWGAEQLGPIKTTNVQNLRCMTTWIVSKPA